jgi:adenylate kinase
MNIVILGPQGSGKGTQAALILKNFNLFYLEAGSLLREAAKTNRQIDEIMNQKGELVPDETIFSLVTEKLERERPGRDGILFDGFPRSVAQYQMIKDWLAQGGKEINLVILIKISVDESIRRLSSRRICKKCGKIWNLTTSPTPPTETTCSCGGELYQREDDKPEAIKARLATYEKVTGPLLEMFESEGKLVQVGGERPVDEIYEEIERIIKK